MRIDILTLFPSMFSAAFGESIIKRACEKGLLSIELTDIRDFAADKRRSVDDKPYGGGPGMVMIPGPVFDAVEQVQAKSQPADEVILLTPQGQRLEQELIKRLAEKQRLILIAGHYEGFDERIRSLATLEISIGDYVLSGGEIPAMVVVDAITRLLPGALGDENSHEEESFTLGMLEYPQYTRPVEFRGMKVPEVLLSGNHQQIKHWRRQQAQERTRRKRPDLAGVDKKMEIKAIVNKNGNIQA